LSVDSIWYRSSKYFSLLISSAGPHFGVGFNSFFILYKDIYMYSHTCIKRSSLRQIKVAIEDRWPLKRCSIHMKCSIRGQERGDPQRWSLNTCVTVHVYIFVENKEAIETYTKMGTSTRN
jgi:hypothetical protein